MYNVIPSGPAMAAEERKAGVRNETSVHNKRNKKYCLTCQKRIEYEPVCLIN